MTREEAIKKIKNEDFIKTATNSKGNIESICDIVRQIDEPYWHTITEDGLPNEAGLYALELKDEFHIRADYYNKLFTYIPHLKMFRYQNQQDIHDYQEFALDENLNCPVIAWHKIPLYEESSATARNS